MMQSRGFMESYWLIFLSFSAPQPRSTSVGRHPKAVETRLFQFVCQCDDHLASEDIERVLSPLWIVFSFAYE
jgi:hypothetical protein